MLNVECRGFLMFVEQIGVINSITREMVMDKLAALDKPAISLDDLKWIVLMVLFNVPGSEEAYEQMEDLIFDEPTELLH
jgi:Smg protein